MKIGDKFRNNDGFVATIEAIRGKKIFFTTSISSGQTDIENFKKRFPVKV